MDNRGNRIKKGKIILAAKGAHHVGERRRGEGACRNYCLAPVFRDFGYLAAFQLYQRVV